MLIFLLRIFFLENKDDDYNLTYIENQEFSSTQVLISNTSESKQLSKREKYEETISDLKNKIKEKEVELASASQIKYSYFPEAFEQELLTNTGFNNISEVIFSDVFTKKKLELNLNLYKNKSDVRGKFVNDTIKLFGISDLDKKELLSVFIHELGHYFDILHLQRKVVFDLSDRFYDISWEAKDILIKNSKKEDFVSGYAMTNKYEDFAESFIYYVLYNDDFLKKTQESIKLKDKYNFFSKYIFTNNEFKETNFRAESELKDYYWDITKIEFDISKFLKYLG